ncbi:MAG: esterase/lipase/thioesterase family protein [uncultured bacterium]|nr:MAG: esterase/lipase/thioesterase family protein [uncultured bacterium]
MENSYAKPRPFFLPSSSGRIFCIYHAPPGDVAPWGNVLVVPGFNEEMNRCRSMVTMQAQALAQQGLGTLVIDLHGTGESDGEYGDARWDAWLEDIHCASAWLDMQPGGCVAFLGIRLGFPLAVSAARKDPKARALIAWQAVVDGKSYFTQFMRMKIAANMDRTDLPKETSGGMRAQLAAGGSIEIAGYEIHPELGMALDKLKLAELLPPENAKVIWFEKVGVESSLAPASEKTIEGWQQSGRAIEVRHFDGPAFWALHDRFLAPDLVGKTAGWLQQFRPGQ